MPCRIYLDTDLQQGTPAAIDAEQARYLRQVMRLQAGDVITVFNGQGGEYTAELRFLAKDGGQCMPCSFQAVDRELPCRVHIIQAANRSEKIETVLQKATEMGAASYQVLSSERATLNLPARKREKRLLRWQKIVSEAAEQSERTVIPDVCWVEHMRALKVRGLCFVLHPDEGARAWPDVRSQVGAADEITLAVGPEGGWTRKELQAFQDMGFVPLCFGARVMRTETAAPALLAAIQAVL